ncbi:MAG: HAD family hydrolase [Ruminococcaceae bacterium]|nr:HAD family hydrolase [Oscillospiraceae bacterium]
MTYTTILFDLDGTLVDSGEGVLKCAELALRHFDLPIPTPEEMRTFVGPPLRDSFLRFGCTEEMAQEAIAVYRRRYTTVGKFELFVYPGIEKLLQNLTAAGCKLYVATSKPETVSVEILQHLGLARYFTYIAGADQDKGRSTKSEVIAHLLAQVGSLDGALMVGDTAYDVIGSAQHGIPCAGVSWGYGTLESIEAAHPAAIVHSTEELLAFVTG